VEFKNFLLTIVSIYFKGSTPNAIEQGIELFTDQNATILENFKLIGLPGSGVDISDQFTFDIIFEINGNNIPQDFINLDYNISLLVGIIKPAHTLYRIRYVFKDDYDAINTITDSFTWDMQNYGYDDVRKNWKGVFGVDRLGTKEKILVVSEDASNQF
jgi:hypothetical protein